nr:hypothetical protein [Streptomyces hirsutus]
MTASTEAKTSRATRQEFSTPARIVGAWKKPSRSLVPLVHLAEVRTRPAGMSTCSKNSSQCAVGASRSLGVEQLDDLGTVSDAVTVGDEVVILCVDPNHLAQTAPQRVVAARDLQR